MVPGHEPEAAGRFIVDGFKNLGTAVSDYYVQKANQARRQPKLKRLSMVLMFLSAAYVNYDLMISGRRGFLINMAATLLWITPLMQLFSDFTMYLYRRGRRSVLRSNASGAKLTG